MRRIGLVLGGGGIVGMAYHGAVLAAIADATAWDPRNAEVVVGTSAGAASGAELRAGIPPCDMAARRANQPFSPEGERLLAALDPPPIAWPDYPEVDVERAREAFRRLSLRNAVFPGSVRPGVLLSVAVSPGRLSADWLALQTRWLNAGADWPEKDLRLCTVDLDRGERVVFRAGGTPEAAAGEAVAASCAIPGVFAPVAVGERLYIDGGAWSPTNVDVAAGMELDTVVVVSPMSLDPSASVDGRDRSVRAVCRAMLLGEAARLRREGTEVAIIEPIAGDARVMGRLAGIDPLDERRCEAVVHQVRESTTARIAAGAIPGLEVLGSRISASLAA